MQLHDDGETLYHLCVKRKCVICVWNGSDESGRTETGLGNNKGEIDREMNWLLEAVCWMERRFCYDNGGQDSILC